jgi:hypothetical protein
LVVSQAELIVVDEFLDVARLLDADPVALQLERFGEERLEVSPQ